MEEEKIPSRSDRNHSESETGTIVSDDGVETERIKPSDTASAADILEWYFSSPKDEPAEFSDEEEHLVKEEIPAIEQSVAGVASVSEDSVSTLPRRSRNEKNEKKTSKKGRRVNPVITAVLAVLVFLFGGFIGYNTVGKMLPANAGGGTGNNVNILVLGCDEREGDSAARSDVIIVATIRTDAKEISLLSIPRDTRVAIPGHGMDKINHSMAYGGTSMVKETVENFLQIPIHHVVKVNFDGFINVIDALGGVNIEVPCRMYKPLEAIDLLPGYQTLDGADALAFVRWRGDGTGDYGRIERQQQFISALTEKLKKMNVKQALNVANAVMDSIETDMSVRQMVGYGMNVIGMDASNVKTFSYTGNSIYIGGVNYVEPNSEEVARIVHEMQYGKEEQTEMQNPATEAENM